MKSRDIDRAIQTIIYAKNKCDIMNKKYPKKYEYELKKIGNITIDKWYATYSPIYYHRRGSLYDSFQVNLQGLDYSVEFDSSLISKFHNNSDYIYELSFIEGYHGGAKNGIDHPHPGIPYWKTPFPIFNQWGRPAKKSWSPYYRMVSEMKKVIKEIDKEKQAEFDKVMDKVQRAINRL